MSTFDPLKHQVETAGVLAGKTIGITASRKAEEQAAAFERSGAQVLLAPTVRIVPVEDDAALLEVTEQVIAHPPQVLLVTTGYGLNGWLEAARARGLQADLMAALEGAEILVRGAKGRGAVRALSWQDAGMAAEERTSALVDLALERGVAGKHVVIQQHGSPDAAQEDRLVRAGATVTAAVPHRWEVPEEPQKVQRLLEETLAGRVDAITFTAAPAVVALFDAARTAGVLDALVQKFKASVIAASVGPVTSEPLEAEGITPLAPERYRLGALIKELTGALSTSDARGEQA